MLYPIRSLLPILKSRLAGAIDGAAWAGLESLASRLPTAWNCGCFELRLAAGEQRVDFSLCAARGKAGQQALAAALDRGEEMPVGKGMRALLEAWTRPETLLCDQVPVIWLEYDLPDAQPQEPFVSLTFFDRDSTESRLGAELSSSDLCSLIGYGLELLGHRGNEAQLRRLESCARSLPALAKIVHIAPLPRWRETRDLRLVVWLPTGRVASWLTEIGWRGSRRQWDTALELFASPQPYLQVALDVGDSVGSYLGLESPLRANPRWKGFLDRLAGIGASDPGKGNAALEWPGEESLRLPDAEWPIRIERSVHVKLEVDVDGVPLSKAYLYFRPRHVLL